MSTNSDYAKELQSKMLELPSVALKAMVVDRDVGASAILNMALRQTVQDSGEAAFNWSLVWDGGSKPMFWAVAGAGPVGEKWTSKRGAGHLTVINHVISRELSKIPSGHVESVSLVNPIADPKHENNAKIQQAGTSAVLPEALNAIAKRAVDAHLLSRN